MQTNSQIQPFWEACGGRGPLVLEVEEEDGSRPIRQAFDRPSLVIGSGSRSDLRIDRPHVSRKHALLQMIGGQLFCLDLDSRAGTRVEEGTAAGGWVAPGRSIRIGTSRVSLLSGVGEAGDGPAPWSNPLSSRGGGRVAGPPTSLVAQGKVGPEMIGIRRALTLIGSSRRCKIRFAADSASRFQAALLRTRSGLWVIDLRSAEGLRVNGATVDVARLEDGDELRVGPLVARVEAPGHPAGRAIAPSTMAGTPAVSPSTARLGAAPDGGTEGELRSLLEHLAQVQRQPGDQLGQVMVMMFQLFGNMHREMVDLVREELEQIRRLAAEMQALRSAELDALRSAAAAPPASPGGDEASRNPAAEPSSGRPGKGAGDVEEPGRVEPARTLDPGEVHVIVGERLAAFERERQGRWNRISRLLLNADH